MFFSVLCCIDHFWYLAGKQYVWQFQSLPTIPENILSTHLVYHFTSVFFWDNSETTCLLFLTGKRTIANCYSFQNIEWGQSGAILVHINWSFILWAWQFPKLLYKDAVLLFQETTASPIFPTPKCLCFALPQSNFMVVVRFRFMVRFSSNHFKSEVQRLNFWVASLSANLQFNRLAVFFRLRLRPVPGLHQAPSLLPHGGINYASEPSLKSPPHTEAQKQFGWDPNKILLFLT